MKIKELVEFLQKQDPENHVALVSESGLIYGFKLDLVDKSLKYTLDAKNKILRMRIY